MSSELEDSLGTTPGVNPLEPFGPVDPNNPWRGAAGNIDRVGFLVVMWIFFSTATLFVFLRLFVRWRQNKYLLADDYWIIFSWLCLVSIVGMQQAQDESMWYITSLRSARVPLDPVETPIQMKELLRWQFPIMAIFLTTIWGVKASFLAAFYRLVRPLALYRRLWYAAAVFTGLAYVGCWVASLTTCDTPSDFFVPGACEKERHLNHQHRFIIYSTVVDITTSLVIMALPVALLPGLQLDTKKKIGLGVAFSLGFIVVGVSIVRMARVLPGGRVDVISLAIWGVIEAAVAVLVGSLLPLKALLSRQRRKYQTGGKSLMKSAGRFGAGGAGGFGKGGDMDERYGNDGSRTVMARAAHVIPLDDMHRSGQLDGGIYVQRTYETHIENDQDVSSRDDDDEAAIVKGQLKA